MLATNDRTLSQHPHVFSNSDQVDHDRQVLAGTLSALSALAVAWLRCNGGSPSQGHWEAVQRADLDAGGAP